MRLTHAFLAFLLIVGLGAPVVAQQKSEGFQFLEAVRERDGTIATDLLNQPGSTVVNTRDLASGETAMHVVAKRRDTIWIKFIAQRGGNPNIADKRGVTPLQIATSLGHVEGVEALLKAGADIENSNSSGETALISAIHRRDLALTKILLANGANADRADNSGRTARDYAQLQGRNNQLLTAIIENDEKREGEDEGPSYGPSF